MNNLKDKIFKTGLQADTDIHNGGTIFGEVYRQVLSFDSNLNATLTNELVSEKHSMDLWNIQWKKRKYTGICKDNEKHIFISFSNETDNLRIDFILRKLKMTCYCANLTPIKMIHLVTKNVKVMCL